MTILVDSQILELLKKQELVIEPFDEKCMQPAGYDLRLGEEALVFEDKNYQKIKIENEIIIQPKKQVAISTLERVRLPPTLVGDIKIRSSFAREGLIGSFGWVDPGFDGHLTTTVFNSGFLPIKIGKGERIIQIAFHKLEQVPTKTYAGLYQKSVGVVPSKRNNLPATKC